MSKKEIITVTAIINASVEKVWNYWTEEEHIKKWNNASSDWHTVRATNDLRVNGRFLSRMEALDRSQGFDFTGVYTNVEKHKFISYTLDDERKVEVSFKDINNKTEVIETFEAENTFSIELQKAGWQSILDHFKEYVEKN